MGEIHIEPHITVEKLETQYLVRDTEGHCIKVVVSERNGFLSISPRGHRDEFVFQNSDPKIVEVVATLILEATRYIQEIK